MGRGRGRGVGSLVVGGWWAGWLMRVAPVYASRRTSWWRPQATGGRAVSGDGAAGGLGRKEGRLHVCPDKASWLMQESPSVLGDGVIPFRGVV